MNTVNSPEQHIWSAPLEKRYVHFIHTVADREVVWMVRSADGELMFEENGKVYICVWPSETFAKMYLLEEGQSGNTVNEVPFSVELNTFLEKVSELAEESTYEFMVFPTHSNSAFISAVSLIQDLNAELERY